MSKFDLFFPVKPLHVNQSFGGDPEYYAKFHDAFGNPYKGHNGTDLMAVHGQPVYAPIDGMAMYTVDAHRGQAVIIRTTEAMDYDKGTCWFSVILGHVIGDTDPAYPAPIPMGMVQTPVKAGDLVAYADNTGAPYESNGDHLHFGLTPCDVNGKALNPGNGYTGCIDPWPYFNGYFAQDANKVLGILQKIVGLLKQAINK